MRAASINPLPDHTAVWIVPRARIPYRAQQPARIAPRVDIRRVLILMRVQISAQAVNIRQAGQAHVPHAVKVLVFYFVYL